MSFYSEWIDIYTLDTFPVETISNQQTLEQRDSLTRHVTNNANGSDRGSAGFRARFRLQIHRVILYIAATSLLTFHQTMVNDTIDIPCYIWLFRALVPSQIPSFIVSAQLHHSLPPKIRIMKIQWLITSALRWSANPSSP